MADNGTGSPSTGALISVMIAAAMLQLVIAIGAGIISTSNLPRKSHGHQQQLDSIYAKVDTILQQTKRLDSLLIGIQHDRLR